MCARACVSIVVALEAAGVGGGVHAASRLGTDPGRRQEGRQRTQLSHTGWALHRNRAAR